MSVYGTFIEHFSELIEPIYVMEGNVIVKTITGIYMPLEGSSLRRRKYTSGNTALDVQEENEIYLHSMYGKYIKEGTLLKVYSRPEYFLRVVSEVPFDTIGGFQVHRVQRVTGSTPDKQEKLNVKEPRFD